MQNKNSLENKMRLDEAKGITLLALVITIVAIIILATIAINYAFGDNGIINSAKYSKDRTEISTEKEQVDTAALAALYASEWEDITYEGLDEQLKINIGEGKYVLEGNGPFSVIYVDSRRSYGVDRNGKVTEEGTIVEDKYPGDITKDEEGNELDGSQEHPYEIWCIEDLVEWSKNYSLYTNSKIILCRNLDFKSTMSYSDSKRTDFGDINGNAEDGNTLMNEMTTELGFCPINSFKGTFDGQGYEIRNLYMTNSDEKGAKDLGLFSSLETGTIVKNLHINVNIESNLSTGGNAKGGLVGGLVGKIAYSQNVAINNIYCSGKIISKLTSGGVVGLISYASNISIYNCINATNIVTEGHCGGIVGSSANTIVVNCYNAGNLQVNNSNKTYISVGGIIGVADKNSDIFNCYNTGDVTNNSDKVYAGAGGIAGTVTNVGEYVNIINCYNTGKTSAKYLNAKASGGILGIFWYNEYKTNIKNCFYDQATSERSVGSKSVEYAQKLTKEQIQNIEPIQNEDGSSYKLIELLNNYIKDNPDNLDMQGWKNWTENQDGYPTFE